jgi:hypothetical protein
MAKRVELKVEVRDVYIDIVKKMNGKSELNCWA